MQARHTGGCRHGQLSRRGRAALAALLISVVTAACGHSAMNNQGSSSRSQASRDNQDTATHPAFTVNHADVTVTAEWIRDTSIPGDIGSFMTIQGGQGDSLIRSGTCQHPGRTVVSFGSYWGLLASILDIKMDQFSSGDYILTTSGGKWCAPLR